MICCSDYSLTVVVVVTSIVVVALENLALANRCVLYDYYHAPPFKYKTKTLGFAVARKKKETKAKLAAGGGDDPD